MSKIKCGGALGIANGLNKLRIKLEKYQEACRDRSFVLVEKREKVEAEERDVKNELRHANSIAAKLSDILA